MVQSKFLWLFGLAASTASAAAPATVPETHEYFYGKNSLSKLHINHVFTEKNCGCPGFWDHTKFAEISKYFGGKLDELIPKKTTTARGHENASPLSIGSNTYTLSLDYSSGYNRPSSSGTAVWSRLISEMLLVANHTLDQSILVGEYINSLGGSHNLTLTVYGDKKCVNVFDPCVKAEPKELNSKHTTRDTPGAGAIDWSDKEAVLKNIKLDVYNTSSFDEAVLNNHTLPEYIYHDDLHMVVETATIKPRALDDSELQGRQYCIPFGFYSYWAEGQWATWGDWLPVSPCLWTGRNPSGGSLAFNVAFTISYAQSWNWGWSPIKSAFSASFTFTITEAYTQAFTYSCNVPGNSVGQIWAQQRIGSGYAYRKSCFSGCGPTRCDNKRDGPNYASAPGNAVYSIGCSTGAENMACASYRNNWVAYNTWAHSPPHST